VGWVCFLWKERARTEEFSGEGASHGGDGRKRFVKNREKEVNKQQDGLARMWGEGKSSWGRKKQLVRNETGRAGEASKRRLERGHQGDERYYYSIGREKEKRNKGRGRFEEEAI